MIQSLIQYWRHTLSDEDLTCVKAKERVVSTTAESIQSGQLEAESIQKLIKEWKKRKKKAQWNQTEADHDRLSGDLIPIIILAKGYYPKREHGQAVMSTYTPAVHYVIHIPALLNPNGQLMPQEEHVAWFGRQYLSPNDDPEEGIPIVGALEDYDRWLETHPFDSRSWDDYILWCQQLSQAVIGDNIPQGFAEQPDVAIALAETVKNAGYSICQLYHILEQTEEIPPLFEKLCNGQQAKVIADATLRIQHLATSRGAMSSEYGLATRQADAVAAFCQLQEADMLAVNGPPGTGKTTLLQSIIASEVVKRTINGEDPAIIVGSSMNNRAITNICEAMNTVTQQSPAAKQFIWANRWLDDIDTLGLYLTGNSNKAKEANKKGYATALQVEREWQGLPERETDEAYIDACQQYWLQQFSGYLGEPCEDVDLKTAIDRLRAEVTRLIDQIQPYQAGLQAYDGINQWWQDQAGEKTPEAFIEQIQRKNRQTLNDLQIQIEQVHAELITRQEKADNIKREQEEYHQQTIATEKERETYRQSLVGIKAKIYRALEPHGFMESVADALGWFTSYSNHKKIARLCELASSDALAIALFQEELEASEPQLWESKINQVIADQSKKDALLKKQASDKNDDWAKTVREHNNNVNECETRCDHHQARYNQAERECQQQEVYLNQQLKLLKETIQQLFNLHTLLSREVVEKFGLTDNALPILDGIPAVHDFDWLLDVSLRHKAFQLSMRYWEARWLIECQQLQAGKINNNNGQKAVVSRFKRWCMLTPCLIVTAHSLPKFFSYKSPPKDGQFFSKFLTHFIDYLIVDEAGQVAPHIGAASFAFAKKAIVVGDIYQLEPFPKIATGTDLANCSKLGLEHLWEDGEPASPHVVSTPKSLAPTGSIMRLAQAASTFVSPDTEREPGIFLDEHRRCRHEIITYCNHLIYGNRLIPKTPPRKQTPPLPPLGWAHVRGQENNVGGSRSNLLEAKAIAAWVKENSAQWCAHYGKSIDNVVAVVTPFKAQAALVRKQLETLDSTFSSMTVGTVHSLQGAEKPIVIFSPTYNQDTARGVFFDNKPNMLNVAVSRAKDSFVVIGDMRLFRKNDKRPSSLLGKMLFASADNELSGVDGNYSFPQQWLVHAERISHLENHRQVLRDSIIQCKPRQQIIITSPWITLRAIQADNLCHLISEAINQRAIAVTIIVDHELSTKEPSHKGREAINLLRNAGATIFKINRMHNKTLINGADTITEGSFNWLSASRQANSQYARHEVSWRISGANAKQAIAIAIKEFEKLGVKIMPADISEDTLA
ncbi:MAG: AAA family ATPase [Cellvibrionaceae bacterium]|nr:AAA family ATPase [Cellvibrionaceae bacterium]